MTPSEEDAAELLVTAEEMKARPLRPRPVQDEDIELSKSRGEMPAV